MRRLFSLFLLSLLCASPCVAQKSATETTSGAGTHTDRAVDRAFEAARKEGPLALRTFLVGMPKGADLHTHLAGAVYAESWIRAAAEDGLCVDTKSLTFLKPPPDGCPHTLGQITATELLAHASDSADQAIYDKLVDAFSMRSFVPYASWSGHDQFFSTFDHFRGTEDKHTGEWLDELATRAAAQNEQYLEIMDTPAFGHAASLAARLKWNDNPAEFRQKLLDAGLVDEVAADKEHAESALAQRDKIEHCGTPQAAPACQVKIHFLYQILRALPTEVVFAQTLLGFETISRHPDLFVGINFVQPEDGYNSMTNYTLQMKMLDYLHSVYPQVHITLHAGELAPGMVPPNGLRSHIRQAIETAHAERIGHGVDVMYEDDANGLLKEMAAKHIMVEINLTSNDGILGIKGETHPLHFYRRAGVPVALSTDDEGVNRSDLTHEYVRAAIEQKLSYADLKQMARTGLEHSFLLGKSLWANEDAFTTPVSECSSQPLGAEKPTNRCQAYLDANEKAATQWEQEHRFHTFEAKW